MASTRILWGQSIGEWTFEMRTGSKEQFQKVTYPLQVIRRQLLIIVTGFVVLPFVSFLLKRDLAGQISGLSLQSINQR